MSLASTRKTIMKILLAVDGSKYTKHMLAYLAAHDEFLSAGNTYTAFTVVSPIPTHAASFVARDALDGYYRERADEVLAPVKAFTSQQQWATEPVHVVGHPAEAIAHYAEQHKIELIVMGTHGHTGLANLVLGSVTGGVLARCTVPVLLIR